MRAMRMIAWTMLALMAGGGPAAAVVTAFPDGRLEVSREAGSGLLPLFLSSDWDQPQPHVVRVIIVFHGVGRNGEGYFGYARKAAELAGEEKRTFIVAPQFLIPEDVAHDDRPEDHARLLRWKSNGRWTDGRDSLGGDDGPVEVSAFDAIDAILARLADRGIFANLKHVVLAGHSAGGQIVQRYAILGKGAGELADIGVHVRYVVANPSSYAYLTTDRPRKVEGCDGYNDWKYGLSDRPRYARGVPNDVLRASYLERDVVYLLGTTDDDPDDNDLDQSCQADAQGQNRLSRGTSYFAYLQKEHSDLRHRLQLVYGIGHSGRRIFTQPCSLAVLFDLDRCGWEATERR